ncbi:MAG: branched-chain amino acid ABC transporter permease [Desulfobacterota bacterium]|nr:branched-chain amino acid ABC transporter permease [Thermodesulfobacteriota bacterium]
MDMTRHRDLIAFIILVAFIPLLFKNPYYINILVFIGIYSIAATGLNLLMGYAGQISLGHAAFYAVGAYTSGILTLRYQVPFPAAAVLALAGAALLAYAIGMPCLRLRGHYLAMATLAAGEIIYIILNAAVPVTGGPSGIAGIPSLRLGPYDLDTDTGHYAVVWCLFVIVLILSRNILDSRIGRALRSLHSSEIAAGSLGVPVARIKLQVFVLSAVYAALAGVLYAHTVTFISPQTAEIMFSIQLITMVVIGGMGHLWGGVVGAAIVTVLPELLSAFHDYELVIYGCILLIMVMFLPGGLVRWVQRCIEVRMAPLMRKRS